MEREKLLYSVCARGGCVCEERNLFALSASEWNLGIFQQAFGGFVTTQIPASVLLLHPDFTLIANEEALAGL